MIRTLTEHIHRWFRPGALWNIDVDLRYLPFARRIRKNNPARILEVGSGLWGITPYVPHTVVGCDATFPEVPASELLPVVARHPLPFRDGTFDTTLSLDTLEHVPREARESFVSELLRVTRTTVLVGFPEGSAAARHDLAMERYYSRQKGEGHPFFVEHRTYGIPKPGEFEELVLAAARRQHRQVSVTRKKNVNITLRALFMRLLWHKRPLAWKIYLGLSLFSRMDWLFHLGTCYRMLYTITLSDIRTEEGGPPDARV